MMFSVCAMKCVEQRGKLGGVGKNQSLKDFTAEAQRTRRYAEEKQKVF
jgi:hypothetical protein